MGRTKSITTDRAERSLLGELLCDPSVIADVALRVRAEDFHSRLHQVLFQMIWSLWSEGKPTDVISVAHRIIQAQEFENFGGIDILQELKEEAATGAHAIHHAEIVASSSLLRRLRMIGDEITSSADSPTGSPQEMLDTVAGKVIALASEFHRSDDQAMSDLLPPAMDRIYARARGDRPSGIPTGFAPLDDIIGGLQPSELVLLAARPSIGKTSLALNLAANVANVGPPRLVRFPRAGPRRTRRALVGSRGPSRPVLPSKRRAVDRA